MFNFKHFFNNIINLTSLQNEKNGENVICNTPEMAETEPDVSYSLCMISDCHYFNYFFLLFVEY